MSAEQFITEHLDLWTEAVTAKSAGGRGPSGSGASGKVELTGLKKLRELILDLAMRGKLVPQNTTEPAAEMALKKIQGERTRLFDAGEIQRPKKLPRPSSEDQPFDLPKGWAWFRVGNCLDFRYGKSLAAKDRDNSGVVDVYGSNGVVGSHSAALTEKPCIIIGRKGSAGALNKTYRPSWTTDVAYYVVPPRGIDFEFCFLLLQSLHLDELGKGIKPGVNRNEAYAIAAALPPEKEQHRIVQKVDELMALCDRLEQQTHDQHAAHETLVDALLDTLTQSADADELADNSARLAAHFDTLFTTEHSIDRLKQAILELGVMGRLGSQDTDDEHASELLQKVRTEKRQLIDSGSLKKAKELPDVSPKDQPFEAPVNWVWCRLDELAYRSESGWSPKCNDAPRTGGAWGVLKVSAVSWGKFQPKENKGLPASLAPRTGLEVQANDFLISRANTADLVARSVIAPKITPPKLMMSDKIIRFVFSPAVEPRYISFFNNSLAARGYYSRVAGGTSSSMKNVTRYQIQMLCLPLPPAREQRRIVRKVDELIALCDQLMARLSQAGETRRQMANAVTQRAIH